MNAARRPAPGFLRWLALAAALLAGGAQAQQQPGHGYDDVQQLLRAGQAGAALPLLDERIAAHPGDPQLRFLRAVALADTNRQDEAIEALVQLTQTYPELPEPYNNLAVLYAGRNQIDKAREALEMAVRARPDYAVAHENLGDIYSRLALASYARAGELAPSAAAQVAPRMQLLRQLLALPPGGR
ncbi:tetratricopeptide repeat protein [Melaminivora sp.]|uniref:tetratricopeptide repeat protein n=1 Tax=Melaminivora sp. TaxID=1933032 RepID=UPI0028B2662D|nr:tetratricopeptide repeat protein [Melaminivora sp.]